MDERNLNYNCIVTEPNIKIITFVTRYIDKGLYWITTEEGGMYWGDIYSNLGNYLEDYDTYTSLEIPPLVKFLSPSNQVLITTAVALSLAFPWKTTPSPKGTSWEEIHKKLVKYGTIFENMDYNPYKSSDMLGEPRWCNYGNRMFD
jgi:hypothetical protein